jgi:hypothetical protein
MTSLKSKPASRLSLESFKATAASAAVKDQVRAITGGALSMCHGGGSM